MKKIFILIAAVTLQHYAHAQLGGFINKVKNKVNDKVTQRADNKVDKAIDKGLDEIEGKKTATPAADAAVVANSNDGSSLKSFTKYDFIAGEKILYAEDFGTEAAGELPLNWNTNGSGEVVKLDAFAGNWLRVHAPFLYLAANTAVYPENYTAEFDLILQLKNNGWMYPTFSLGFLSSNNEPATSNSILAKYDTYEAVKATLYPEQNNSSRVLLESFTDAKNYFKSDAKNYAELQNFYGKPVHIAIQVQKERFRMWVNATKIFDVPKAVAGTYKMNQLFFKVGQTNYNDEQYAIYISNIKTATGLPDTRHKLIEEGNFSTTGILFDVNAAVIKPESFGIIKEIAAALKENPSVKIRITGHTSSDGDDKANMELSQKRAAAVKDALVNEFGVDAAVIETAGKGETAPVADNKTKEGKAANRRVEFTKL